MTRFLGSRSGLLLTAAALMAIVGLAIGAAWATIPFVVVVGLVVYPRNTAAAWAHRDEVHERLAQLEADVGALIPVGDESARRFPIVGRRLDQVEARLHQLETVEVEARERVEYRLAELNTLLANSASESEV